MMSKPVSLLVAALALLTAAGCSDRALDTGLVRSVTGPVPPADAPSPVRPMTGQDRSYPNLATVPPRPSDVPTPEQREADLRKLEMDREAAKEMQGGLRRPRPVPPPPDIVPGKG